METTVLIPKAVEIHDNSGENTVVERYDTHHNIYIMYIT